MPEKDISLLQALTSVWEFLTVVIGGVVLMWMQAWNKINGKASRQELAAAQDKLYTHIDEGIQLQRAESERNIRAHRKAMVVAQQEGRDDLLKAQDLLYSNFTKHLDSIRVAMDAQVVASAEERRKDREYLNTLYVQHVATTNRRQDD